MRTQVAARWPELPVHPAQASSALSSMPQLNILLRRAAERIVQARSAISTHSPVAQKLAFRHGAVRFILSARN